MRRGNTWWCMESLGLESSVLLTSVSGSHHASLTGNALLCVLFRSSSFTAQPAAVLPRSTSHSCRRRPSTDTAATATATARYIHHRPQPACLYTSRLSVNSIVIASVSCVFLYFSCLYTLYCYYNVFVTVHAWPALMGVYYCIYRYHRCNKRFYVFYSGHVFMFLKVFFYFFPRFIYYFFKNVVKCKV